MATIKELSVGRKDLFLLHPDSITEKPGWNVRTECEDLNDHIKQLAESISEIGVQQPLTVYMDNGVPVLTDGHCRMAAVKMAIANGADIKAIPVRVEDRYASDVDRTMSMLTRNNYRPLAFGEQAEVIRRLLAFNQTVSDISRKTGYSRQHIDNMVHYLSAPQEVKEMVEKGEVSATTAVNQVKKSGDQAKDILTEAVTTARKEGKTRATSRHIEKSAVDIIRPIEDYAGKLPTEDIERMSKILSICGELRGLVY